MKVIRKRLDEVQTRFPFTRWNDICECVEISFDEGETWVESPENDPRYGRGFRAPALTGDVQCDAAARMVAVIRAQVDAAIDASTAVGLATALLTIVTAFVPGINLIVAVFVAVAGAVLAFGSAALAADFTEENYDRLVCIFQNNIDANGQVSAEQLTAILVDIEAEFGISVIYPVCELLFNTLGENGFANAAALGTATGDCTDCNWCRFLDFTVDDYDFAAGSSVWGLSATWALGVGWQAHINATRAGFGDSYSFLAITRWITANVETIELFGAVTYGTQNAYDQSSFIRLEATTLATVTYPVDPITMAYDGFASFDTDNLGIEIGIGYNNTGGTAGGSGTLSGMKLRGTGTPPNIGIPCEY